MACERQSMTEMKRLERKRQLEALKKALLDKKAKLVRLANSNKVTIQGWAERGEWCDECAIRVMRLSTDARIRQMVEEAAPTKAVLEFGHGHGHTHTHDGHTHTH